MNETDNLDDWDIYPPSPSEVNNKNEITAINKITGENFVGTLEELRFKNMNQQ